MRMTRPGPGFHEYRVTVHPVCTNREPMCGHSRAYQHRRLPSAPLPRDPLPGRFPGVLTFMKHLCSILEMAGVTGVPGEATTATQERIRPHGDCGQHPMTPNTDQWRAPDCDWGHPGGPDWELELDQQQRPPATTGEAISEWVRHCGSDPHRIGQQWLLTEYDTFVRNPQPGRHSVTLTSGTILSSWSPKRQDTRCTRVTGRNSSHPVQCPDWRPSHSTIGRSDPPIFATHLSAAIWRKATAWTPSASAPIPTGCWPA